LIRLRYNCEDDPINSWDNIETKRKRDYCDETAASQADS
jgi:hypothetical protein